MNHANVLVLAALSLSLAACVGDVPLEGKPCPCVTGFACDLATHRCVATRDAGASADSPAITTNYAIGRACDIRASAGPSQAVYNASASECPSNLCLKPTVQANAMMVEPQTQATCSTECIFDSDCDGELRDPTNPLDQRCAQGFACSIPFTQGPLSCKKLCMCKDFLNVSVGALTPIPCAGTTSSTPTSSTPISSATGVGQQTDIKIAIAPTRKVDIVTMVDNSPSMAPKVSKLNAQFPKLMEALKDPNDGTLPDLRVAIIDSDLGTGGAYPNGSCGPKNGGIYGDQGHFQMLQATTCGVTNADALWLEYAKWQPLNYTGDISSVFACLASGLGTLGCGEEHQLQAFEFALVAGGIGNEQQQLMLRPNAYLALIFLSDEDDCSAAPNDGMFGDKPELQGELPSLRCATRAHTCAGAKLTASGPGYPTSSSFTHAFNDCRARTDSCPNPTDTSVATDCSPLRDIHSLANELKSLKEVPDEQILVAGIFGWPRSDADMASAQYKIAPVPNPNTADTLHPTVYDTWPVCYDPNHLPSPATTDVATGFDATAAGWGATGGLRESAFVDEFGPNGLKFSICEPDFAKSMATIGGTVAKKQQNLCVPYKLVDIDSATPGVQADCRVAYRVPVIEPSGMLRYDESALGLPQCPANAVNGNVSTDCWQLTSDETRCPQSFSGQLVNVLRTAQEISDGPLTAGTLLSMQCRTCPVADPGAVVDPGCNY
jgi:hypothetical protein